MYNLAYRHDDKLIDVLAEQGVAYVPFFPLGGYSPVQSSALSAVAARLDTSPMAVALAWLLRRSPNVLLSGRAAGRVARCAAPQGSRSPCPGCSDGGLA